MNKMRTQTLTTINSSSLLHMKFNSMPLYTWEQIKDIPFESGIYVMFEKGEKHRGYKRIVRVGTHNSDDGLKTGLGNHYINQNRHASVLRKNIGGAILNAENESYLPFWETNADEVKKFTRFTDREYEREIENRVTDYLRNNITFTYIKVSYEHDRLRLVEGIAATLKAERKFKASKKWLGLKSPVKKIRADGMW